MGGRAEMTWEEWLARGEALFGPDRSAWRFKCPVCGHVATPQDWKKAGAPEGSIAFSCLGRWVDGAREAFGGTGAGPCNYSGGGFFALNPVLVRVVVDGKEEIHPLFDFADPIAPSTAQGVAG